MAGRVAFEVRLGKPYLERVRLWKRCFGRPVGVLERFGRPIATFMLTESQLKKVRSRRGGALRVLESQIQMAQKFCGSYGR